MVPAAPALGLSRPSGGARSVGERTIRRLPGCARIAPGHPAPHRILDCAVTGVHPSGMRPGGRCLWVAALLCVACGGSRQAGVDRPDVVRIAVVSAIIGPGRMNGAPWDPGRAVPNSVFTALGEALRSPDPYEGVEEIMTSPAVAGLPKPDPAGTASISVGFGPFGRRLEVESESSDTFTPVFRGPPAWNALPFGDPLTLRLELRDRDPGGDGDEIGIVEIGDEELVEALRDRTAVHQVAFGEATDRQLLFLGVSVTRAR